VEKGALRAPGRREVGHLPAGSSPAALTNAPRAVINGAFYSSRREVPGFPPHSKRKEEKTIALEELCHSELWNAVCAVRDRTPLVYPKGQTWGRKIDPWEGFFSQADTGTRWSYLPKKRMDSRSYRPGSDIQKAWLWFNSVSDRIVDGYIRDKYQGDIRKAMRECGTYNAMHDDYLAYFGERRKKFLEKTEALIGKTVEELAKKGKLPQSHGGVANLLKVLTRTMKEQGSGINTIAKMQYAICIQAGIYVIPEFLTDVLVADEIAGITKL